MSRPHWSVKPVLINEFNYELPERLIAQHPKPERPASRLLHVGRHQLADQIFKDLPSLLCPGDLLVVNNTRVLKARLLGRKETGGRAELLLERMLDPFSALFQVRVSKPLKQGGSLIVGEVRLTCAGRDGQFYRLVGDTEIADVLEQYGTLPLPPYIDRQVETGDSERYQTVFSRAPGAVAAPTAGLHFDDGLLDQIRQQGVQVTEVTLHVGAGTFQPVRGDLSAHVMHEEHYAISPETVGLIEATKARGGRIVAVGTTVIRALESAALKAQGCLLQSGSGATRLFIRPGFRFQVVDCLVTNFHLPRSTLLMLVSAFAGHDRIMKAYAHAVAAEYRFFSYGDAMWLYRDV